MSSIVSFDSSQLAGTYAPSDPIVTALQNWLCKYIAQILNVSPERIDPDVKFDRHGLDSSAAVGLAGDLSAWLNCDLDPALTYDFPTIAELSAELGRRDAVRASLQHLIERL
jgi:acyl carrier protein